MESPKNFLKELSEEERSCLAEIAETIRQDHSAIAELENSKFKAELELFDSSIALFVKFLEGLRRTEYTRFEEALLILSSKMVSDAQCTRLCVTSGWTGTALGVERMFQSARNMILFLGYYPEYLEMWFQEKHDSYQTDKEFKRTFSEGNISSSLSKVGFSDNTLTFQLLSKGSHASYFGMQVYASKGHLTFHPHPNIFQSLVSLSETAATISALLQWLIEKIPDVLFKVFPDEGKRKEFVKLHQAINKACGVFMRKVSEFLFDTQDEREAQGGTLLQRIDKEELDDILRAVKADPPLRKKE